MSIEIKLYDNYSIDKKNDAKLELNQEKVTKAHLAISEAQKSLKSYKKPSSDDGFFDRIMFWLSR